MMEPPSGCDCHSCKAELRILARVEQLLQEARRPRALLTVDEAAGYLAVSATTVREAITAGELPVVELGAGGRAVRLAIADLEAFVEGRTLRRSTGGR